MTDSPKRILVVDDEPTILNNLARLLSRFGYEAVTAQTGEDGLQLLESAPSLAIVDVALPDMLGFDVVTRFRERHPHRNLPFILVTGHRDRETRLRAVQAGVSDFLTKPFDTMELRLRIETQLKLKEFQDELIRHQITLERRIAEQTAELARTIRHVEESRSRLKKAHLDTLRRLAVAAEYKDEHTASHIKRVGHYCALIARLSGLSEGDIALIGIAAPLHDVGKIGIPDSILLKPGRLTEDERKIMKQHTDIGARILGGSDSRILQTAQTIAESHHEWWDGNGYPKGLAGEEIPLFGRITAVADVFDALTSKRPYKPRLSNVEAYDIMLAARGSQFDPTLFDLFFEQSASIEMIQARFRDEPVSAELSTVFRDTGQFFLLAADTQ